MTLTPPPPPQRMVQPGFEPESLGGGSSRPLPKNMVQPGLNQDQDLTLLGRGTPPKKKPVNRELPEKLLNTTQRRQSQKVAQRERGSNEPKKSRKLLRGAKLRPKPPFWAPNGAAKFLQIPQTC